VTYRHENVNCFVSRRDSQCEHQQSEAVGFSKRCLYSYFLWIVK